MPNKELCRALVQLFLTFVDGLSLARFSELFLLQSNSSPLRWQAHRLLHTLYQYAGDAQRVSIVEMLWDMWPGMPNHGHKAAQLVDLLGYLTISTPQVLEKVRLAGFCTLHLIPCLLASFLVLYFDISLQEAVVIAISLFLLHFCRHKFWLGEI